MKDPGATRDPMLSGSHETPNPAASGNGAITILFHVGRLVRAVPEPQRSA